MIRPIVTRPHPLLRKQAEEVGIRIRSIHVGNDQQAAFFPRRIGGPGPGGAAPAPPPPPARGMPRVRRMTVEEADVLVAYVRSLGRGAPTRVTGNAQNGHTIYDRLDCKTCHVIGGQGGGQIMSMIPQLMRLAETGGLELIEHRIDGLVVDHVHGVRRAALPRQNELRSERVDRHDPPRAVARQPVQLIFNECREASVDRDHRQPRVARLL